MHVKSLRKTKLPSTWRKIFVAEKRGNEVIQEGIKKPATGIGKPATGEKEKRHYSSEAATPDKPYK